MPGKIEFIDQFKELGIQVEDLGEQKVAFSYCVQTGRFAGKDIKVGFDIPQDFSLTPPSGPHISPRLLPLQSGGSHPSGGIHESPFGADWQYWSRPIQHWNQTKRTVKDILAHIRHLFDSQ
jgi:hypothetical protein